MQLAILIDTASKPSPNNWNNPSQPLSDSFTEYGFGTISPVFVPGFKTSYLSDIPTAMLSPIINGILFSNVIVAAGNIVVVVGS